MGRSLAMGCNPTPPTTFPKENDECLTSRTDFAQIVAESESQKMKFPKVIRHRKAEVTIYGKKKAYPFYRLAYRVNGKRRMKSFATFRETKAEADKKVRELSSGSQSLALTTKEVTAALTIREALESHHRETGRNINAIQAVTGYLDAMKLLPADHNLADAVRGYLGIVAVVQRKPLAEAVAEFCEARKAKAVALPGKRPALNPTYVANTARQLNEFAGTFSGDGRLRSCKSPA